jgi:hypothetical protein
VLHKFNTLVRLCIVAFLVIPFPVLADHVPTQPPYNQSIEIDTTNGDIKIGIYTSDGFEDSPPEKYTIFFDIDNDVTTDSFCVSTSFGHTGNLQWNYHTISLSDLQTYFANPYGNFRTKIRSDNDTDNSYSTLTTQMAIDIPNQEPFVGVENWSAPTTTCNDTSTTTTTSSTLPPTTEAAAQEEVVEETTTTSSTTTTTEPPPPPPTTTTTTLYVVVNDDGSTSEYTEREVKDGTVDRDNERKSNDEKWSCYMTNAQLERGDCDNYNASLVEEEVVEEKEEEVIIKEDEKEQPDTEEIISDDDVVVPEVVVEDKDEDPIDESKEEIIEDELDQEIPGDDDIREEGVQEEDVKDEDNKEEIIKEEEEIEETKEIILEPEEEPQEFEGETVQDLVEDIKEIEVEELETEQVIEVLTEVADVGVENLTEASEDVLEVVSEVIQEVITIATEEVLTEQQVEVVQEVLNLEEPEDVQIIAEAVKEDKAVAEAVEEYVERAVKNADVEDYNLADVVTEIQTEEFLADPVGAFTDIDIAAIDLTTLGDTMTSTQKEKAQEVVVPVIIASQIVASVQVVPVRIRRRV